MAQVRAGIAGWAVAPRIVVEPADKWAAFRRARAALAASGTVTLELALAGVPTVAAYRLSFVEWNHRAALAAAFKAAERHPCQSGSRRERHSGISAVRLHAGAPRRGALCRSCPTRRSGNARSRPSAGSMPSWPSAARRRAPRPRRSSSMWRAPRRRAVLTADRTRLYHCGRHPAKAATKALPSETSKESRVSKSKKTIRKSAIRAAITGVFGYVPPDLLTNAELAKMVDTSDEWIVERTGIRERHILKGKGLGTSHMGAEAVRGLLEQDRDRVRRRRLADLRHDDAGSRLSLDRQSDLRHGRHPQYRQLRRAGGLLRLRLCAHHRDAIHRDREIPQDRRGRRRQDVGDHRLHRPRHLRAVRRRRRRGPASSRAESTASSTR